MEPADQFPKSFAEFRNAYVTTMLWAETDGDTQLDDNFGINDLSESAAAIADKDCRAFFNAHCTLFTDEHCLRYGPDFGPDGRAGRDFWLSRNHHGAGFWDGAWAEPAATTLNAAAHAFGELNPYPHNGEIYLD